MYLLMWRNALDRARDADYAVELSEPSHQIYDFAQGDVIARVGEERTEPEVERILDAWKRDRTNHLQKAPGDL
jgi:hypothetical protein